MDNENIRCCQWECEKKVLRCLKQSYFEKKQLFPTGVLFLWPVRYCEVIFTGIIQTELELSID